MLRDPQERQACILEATEHGGRPRTMHLSRLFYRRTTDHMTYITT